MFLPAAKTLNGTLVRTRDFNGDGVPDVVTTSLDAQGRNALQYLSSTDGTDLLATPLPAAWQIAWVISSGSALDAGGAADLIALGLSDLPVADGGNGSSGSGGPPTRHFGLYAQGDATAQYAADGPPGDDTFAQGVAGIANPDGGAPELAVGSGGLALDAGTLEFLSLPTGALARTLPVPQTATWEFASGVVELRANGTSSLLVVSDPSGANFSGSVYAFDRASLAQVWVVSGDQGAETFGDVLLAPGDLNGDGVDDLVVGAHNDNAGVGRVVALNGATGQPLWHTDGRRVAEAFGATLTTAGDVDGDGVTDLLVSAPTPGFPPVCGQGGRFVLLSGRTGAILLDIEERTPWDWTSAGLGTNAAVARVVQNKTVDLIITAPAAEWSTDAWAGQPSGIMLGLRCTAP